MLGVSTIIEIKDTTNSILKSRSETIAKSNGLGPPDTCLVLREYVPTGLKKLVSKPYTKPYYHYIYGVDTSSLASVAAYFKHFLDSYANKSSKSKVIFGCFCAYDLFSKMDIRVEIYIPGNTTAFMLDPNGNRYKVDESNWTGCYLSSGLRFLYPNRGTAVAHLEFFKDLDSLERFFEAGIQMWNKLGFVLGDIEDTLRYGVNLLFPALSRYLLKRKRFKVHNSLFKKYIDKDPLILTMLANSCWKIGKIDEISKLLSKQIKTTPHAFPLYYTAAKSFLKRGEVSSAIQLCQFLIELNLEVYAYWHLLIQCYVKNKDYSLAFLCLNNLPHYEIASDHLDLEVNEDDLVLPEKIAFSAAGNIWIKPRELDFRPFTDQPNQKSAKEKLIMKQLSSLPAVQLTGSKVKAYRLLVKIEKNIEWENMLSIKKDVLQRASQTELEQEKIITQNFSSFDGRSGFTRSLFQTFSQDFAAEDPAIDEDLMPVQMLTYRNYFLMEGAGNRLGAIMNTASRVQSQEMTELFSSLWADLKAVYEWQKENSDIQAVHALKNKSIPYSGDLWLRRGLLSERLQKMKLAERAYRYVVEKGFSIFAWFRLMEIYVKIGNPKAVIVCIIELIKQLEQEKVYFDLLPPWIEEILAKLCRGCGIKQILSLAGELNIKRYPALNDSIEALKYWKVDGVTGQ